jgi:hypothetical protein
MIISKIKLNPTKQQGINQTQQIIICCDQCAKEYSRSILAQKVCFKKYNLDLCRGCQQKEQYKLGLRSKDQCYKAGNSYKGKYKGKSLEEILGKEESLILRKKRSENSKGKKNSMYGKNYQCNGLKKYSQNQKGKKLEELYGKEKSENIKRKLSIASSGKNNPMYGRPSPIGSGNGWSGWYKGWHFRSIHELSYMINVIERFKMKWKNAEIKNLKIEYLDYNKTKRTYVADFLINNKYLVEIKPKKLHNSKLILLKKEAAIKFCKEKNLIYKLIDPSKLLYHDDIKELIKLKYLEFTDRYKEKWEQLLN